MSLQFSNRPTWAEIDLENLAFNFHSVKSFVGQNIEYMAVVKADAYGHGAVQCASKLEHEGIDWLGVAIPEEGVELREAGIGKPILCLGGFWNGQENIILDNQITPVIFQPRSAEILDLAAKRRNIIADVHIKIDTGMGRIGVRLDEIKTFISALLPLKNIKVSGIMSHFASADDLSENDFTNLQIERFKTSVAEFESRGFRPVYKDVANSPGAIAHVNSRSNLVRLGGILYGLGGDVIPKDIESPQLKPVMSVNTRISQLKKVGKGETLGYSRTFRTERESLIATIPIGYHDGFPRQLSNIGKVIVNETFAPVVGRISMDWTIIDVTDVPKVQLDDKVTVIGTQKNKSILAEDLAKGLNTISYEVTCGINKRVLRKYL